MPTAKGNLTEPHVLAQAKRRLFPDNGATDTYAVVDTQFASGQWLAEQPIDSSTKENVGVLGVGSEGTVDSLEAP